MISGNRPVVETERQRRELNGGSSAVRLGAVLDMSVL